MSANAAGMRLTPSASKPSSGRAFLTGFSDDRHLGESEGASRGASSASGFRRRNALIFTVLSLFWLVLDQASKALFNSYELGEVIAGPFAGVFDLRLVHNVGAAWGIFGGATTALGFFSLLVCALLLVYLFMLAPDSPKLASCGLALVFAGGVGNAIDRFLLGYVVDFIEPVFVDFPVFNIADIGVTCGFALFFISLLLECGEERKAGGSARL